MFTFVKERSEAFAREFTPFVVGLDQPPHDQAIQFVSRWFRLFLTDLYYIIPYFPQYVKTQFSYVKFYHNYVKLLVWS